MERKNQVNINANKSSNIDNLLEKMSDIAPAIP